MEKIAVITGGSKGLGKGLAQELLRRGHKAVICARNKEEIEATAKDIGAMPFVADVANEADIERLAAFAVSTFGRIDIWINNAGVWLPHSPIEDLDIGRVRAIFEVNVFGAMNGSKTALIQMRKQGSGMIVNIVSTSGLVGRPTSSGYAASKWAERGFTDSLREECKGSGIRVIGVFPGGMQTALFDEQRPADIGNYMSYESVAKTIVENLEQAAPQEEQIIRRPAQ